MRKDISYYWEKVALMRQKRDNIKRKRRNLKYGEINKRIMYKKLEQRYEYKLDKYSDLCLYCMGKERLLKSSKESQRLYEEIQFMRKKLNRVGKKKFKMV